MSDLVETLRLYASGPWANGAPGFVCIEAAEAITALQSQLAEARAERDALVAVAGDAYYVLTYIEALSNDDATKAACAEVRTKIDALKEPRHD
jgi:hypothetical protein